MVCGALGGDMKATKESILKHDETIRAVFSSRDVIPVHFGTIVNSSKEAENFLKDNFDTLERLFSEVEGKIELNLIMTWNKDGFTEEIDSREITEYKRRISQNKRAAQQDKIELGKMVEQKVNELRDKYTEEIISKLKVYSEKIEIGENLNARMLLKAAFLIKKSDEELFDKALNEIYQKYSAKFTFKYIGPLPPYSFIKENFVLD
jgi:hypothetical protein